MGSVADTVARVLRGCLENMPEGAYQTIWTPSVSNAKSLLIIHFNLSFTANNISKESVNSSLQWVTKWVDYSNKYGFGYQLSDHTVGVLFNNGTHMSLLSDKKYVEDPRCLFSLKIIDFMKTNMSFWPSGQCITMQSWDNVQSSPLQKPQSSLSARSPS